MIALAAAAALAAATPQDAASQLAQLEHMYQQSCSVKAYGSYDDICNGLRKQMKEAQKQAKRQARADERDAPARAEAASQPAGPTLGFAPTKN